VFCKGLIRALLPSDRQRDAYLRDEGARSQLQVLPFVGLLPLESFRW
jgi:hypothetical protein